MAAGAKGCSEWTVVGVVNAGCGGASREGSAAGAMGYCEWVVVGVLMAEGSGGSQNESATVDVELGVEVATSGKVRARYGSYRSKSSVGVNRH